MAKAATATKKTPSRAKPKKTASRAGSAASDVPGAAEALAARQAAAAGAKAAGRAVSSAASMARTPLIVAGGAAAGIVGGLVLRARGADILKRLR